MSKSFFYSNRLHDMISTVLLSGLKAANTSAQFQVVVGLFFKHK